MPPPDGTRHEDFQAVLDAIAQHGQPTIWAYILVAVVAAAFSVGASWAVLNQKIATIPDKYAVQEMVSSAMRESPWAHDKVRVEAEIDDCLKRIATLERLYERIQVQYAQIIDGIEDLQSDMHERPRKGKSR